MQADPLPCPFCGSRDVGVDMDTESVVCECSATGPSMLSREDFGTDGLMKEAAVAAWNKRSVSQ